MQAAPIITKVRRQLVETVAAFWQDQELLDLLNDAELDFNNQTRILEGVYTTSTVQGQQTYALPTNWLSARAIFYNNPSVTTPPVPGWYRIIPTNLEKKAQENPNFLSTSSVQQDKPREYFIWGSNLYLDPIPDTTGSDNLIMFFKAKPIPLTATTQDINLDDSFKDTITNYILWRAWEKEKETELADMAHTAYVQGVKDARRWLKKKSGDQRFRLDIISPFPISGFGDTQVKGFNPFI